MCIKYLQLFIIYSLDLMGALEVIRGFNVWRLLLGDC